MELTTELKSKIKRRAKRAWESPSTKQHRITQVDTNTLQYRVHGQGQVTVKKNKAGAISIVDSNAAKKTSSVKKVAKKKVAKKKVAKKKT